MFQWTINLEGLGGHKNYYHAAVAAGHKLYSFGGYYGSLNDSDPIEVHIFNTVYLCWRKLPPVTDERGERPIEVPSGRFSHTAVLIDDLIYIWGGLPYSTLIYAFDVDLHRWYKPDVSGTRPEARFNHSACVLKKVMYIYGGFTHPNGRTNDIYMLDTSIMVWSSINPRGTPPAASDGHSATIIGTQMFVFGGLGTGGPEYNTITVFDTDTNCWLNSTPSARRPKGRWAHSAFGYKGKLYIFGGNIDPYLNGLWEFNPETFVWMKVKLKGKGPCSRMAKMCCCMVGDRIMIFGGCNTPDDLYILDFSPSLKSLCKLAVIQYASQQSELPHNVRKELAAMNYQQQQSKQRKRKHPSIEEVDD